MSKQRWKDTLPDASYPPSLVMATTYLTSAICGTDNSAALAAAHIRAYRKSLGVESDRVERDVPPSRDVVSDLWLALEYVAVAGRYASYSNHENGAARMLRYAEAVLREQWKRRQS